MPVNVAFGPSAGLVGQFGYGTGKRQYADQKAQIERQSKRQMLSDAMNFTKFLQDTRRPEEDQRRSMERMREQQKLQKDTLSHQSAIKQTDYTWEQGQKDDLRIAQSDALIELDARLKKEMSNLPADMSPLEKQHYYQRQYDIGSHRIGTAKAPGAEIKPFKHYDYKGNDYRINADRSITDIGAEKAARRAKAAKETTAMITATVTAKNAVGDAAAKPFISKIDRLEARRIEIKKSFELGAGAKSEPPKKSDGEDEKAYKARHASWQRRNDNYDTELKSYNTELRAIDKAIDNAEYGMQRAVNRAHLSLASSLGGAGEDNIAGPMGRSLFDDARKERLSIDAAIEEQKLLSEQRDTFEAAKRGDAGATQEFLSDPRYRNPAMDDYRGSDEEAMEWGPLGDRSYAESLLGQGGPTPGVPFKLESGGTLPPSTMQAIINNDRIRELYPEVSKRDIKKFNTEYEEKNPVGKHTIPDPKDGKPKEVNVRAEDAAAASEAWAERKALKERGAVFEKMRKNEGNKNLFPDIDAYLKITNRMAEIQEYRHEKLADGEGDIFAKETHMSDKEKGFLKEFEGLEKEELAARKVFERLATGGLGGKKFNKGLEAVRKLRDDPLAAMLEDAARSGDPMNISGDELLLREARNVPGATSIFNYLSKSEAELADPKRTPWYLRSNEGMDSWVASLWDQLPKTLEDFSGQRRMEKMKRWPDEKSQGGQTTR